MRFTAEEALEAHEEGEPIMISRAAADKLIAQHNPGDDVREFWARFTAHEQVNAWAVLEWLGY